ncbi:GNAT family N-acetyltransferase [Salinarimonas soli]|uniref:GNAT family N-acetyltransferase n=1 Tax=Salinarimonas soli TaxID=1638099 RepID=A0A5B2V7L0_9HYPH|nr:GNAT family N-acetyltransferase [Salinarimonas soli]KAA2235004.1 GNAT family N-acetyltransferase [Salinarimonas soli]
MTATTEAPALTIRPLAASDSIDALTALLHRAYAGLGARGLNYTAVDQTPEVTRKRIAGGTCLVAERDGRVVGTLMVYPPGAGGGCPWFERPEVAKIGQFGVEPACHGGGVGARLLAHAEAMARALGAGDIALDTAEDAAHLVAWYGRCGYRLVDHVRWEGKTYRSVIMSKRLA